VTITFFALRLAAGDPVASLLSQGLATQQQAERIRSELGYDQPIITQYGVFLVNLIQGDLGRSLYSGRSVALIIAEQLPWTIQLALLSLLIAIGLGTALGIIAARKRRNSIGQLSETIAGVATALPVAAVGILVLLVFSSGSQFLGINAGNIPGQRLLLPSLVLGFAVAGPFARLVQSSYEQSLQAKYTLAAKARGSLHRGYQVWYSIRPSIGPVVTFLALEAAFLLSGTVVTETVFSRPGLGRLLINSILQGDFAIVQGIVILATILYTASRVLADGATLLLDPRTAGR
jgi:ABC-type dipeptide/oligopeptide/nickel transport system permease component